MRVVYTGAPLPADRKVCLPWYRRYSLGKPEQEHVYKWRFVRLLVLLSP